MVFCGLFPTGEAAAGQGVGWGGRGHTQLPARAAGFHASPPHPPTRLHPIHPRLQTPTSTPTCARRCKSCSSTTRRSSLSPRCRRPWALASAAASWGCSTWRLCRWGGGAGGGGVMGCCVRGRGAQRARRGEGQLGGLLCKPSERAGRCKAAAAEPLERCRHLTRPPALVTSPPRPCRSAWSVSTTWTSSPPPPPSCSRRSAWTAARSSSTAPPSCPRPTSASRCQSRTCGELSYGRQSPGPAPPPPRGTRRPHPRAPPPTHPPAHACVQAGDDHPQGVCGVDHGAGADAARRVRGHDVPHRDACLTGLQHAPRRGARAPIPPLSQPPAPLRGRPAPRASPLALPPPLPLSHTHTHPAHMRPPMPLRRWSPTFSTRSSLVRGDMRPWSTA